MTPTPMKHSSENNNYSGSGCDLAILGTAIVGVMLVYVASGIWDIDEEAITLWIQRSLRIIVLVGIAALIVTHESKLFEPLNRGGGLWGRGFDVVCLLVLWFLYGQALYRTLTADESEYVGGRVDTVLLALMFVGMMIVSLYATGMKWRDLLSK